jgi:hypothetical protein
MLTSLFRPKPVNVHRLDSVTKRQYFIVICQNGISRISLLQVVIRKYLLQLHFLPKINNLIKLCVNYQRPDFMVKIKKVTINF